MFDFLASLLDTSDFVAPSDASGWTSGLRWLHNASDLAIWIAYLTISCLLVYFVRRRGKTSVPPVFWLFVLFVLAIGTVHLFEVLVYWWPVYRFTGMLKLVAAIASWGAVIALVCVIPKVLALRTPDELGRHIARREHAVQALRESEALYHSLVESLPLNIFRKDLGGRVVFGNQSFCQIQGMTLEELSGKTEFDTRASPSPRSRRVRRGRSSLPSTGVSPVAQTDRDVALPQAGDPRRAPVGAADRRRLRRPLAADRY